MSRDDLKDIPLADDTDTETVSAPPAPPAIARRDMNRTAPDENESGVGMEDMEEKVKLISQVLELQNTLDDLSQRVDNVKEESLKLKSENQVLGQYIQNLMSTSAVFHSTSAPPKRALK